jgi:N-acetylmuramoyl-L-alanine amidase
VTLSLLAVVVVILGIWGTGLGSGTRGRKRPNAADGTPVDAKLFAAGACVRYSPLVGNRHLTIFVDAGHGGIDPGAIGQTESGASIEEANLTLPMTLDTMALLRDKGFSVVLSRNRATNVVRLNSKEESDGVLTLQGAHDDVEDRDICANKAKANALVGIYLDYGSSPQNAGSVTAYDASRSFSSANLRLATLLQNDTMRSMNSHGWQIPSEGTLPDSQLGSSVPTDATTGIAALAADYNHLLLLGPYEADFQTDPSTMPGAVIEPLYITDPFEGSIADSPSGQKAVASGIATAVEQYFPLPVKKTK